MASPIIEGMALAVQLCKALGLDPNRVRRIVLDFNLNEPVAAYVEMYGDTKLLKVDWTSLEGATISREEID